MNCQATVAFSLRNTDIVLPKAVNVFKDDK
jgi:hypothetical protein